MACEGSADSRAPWRQRFVFAWVGGACQQALPAGVQQYVNLQKRVFVNETPQKSKELCFI